VTESIDNARRNALLAGAAIAAAPAVARGASAAGPGQPRITDHKAMGLAKK
jgi:hypothetical protein